MILPDFRTLILTLGFMVLELFSGSPWHEYPKKTNTAIKISNFLTLSPERCESPAGGKAFEIHQAFTINPASFSCQVHPSC